MRRRLRATSLAPLLLLVGACVTAIVVATRHGPVVAMRLYFPEWAAMAPVLEALATRYGPSGSHFGGIGWIDHELWIRAFPSCTGSGAVLVIADPRWAQ